MQVQSPVVAALAPRDRVALFERAVPRRLQQGQALYLAGDRSGRVHLVVRGVVKLVARSSDGQAAILGLALAGEVVGEAGMLEGAPQSLDAIAAVPCDLLGLPGDLLETALGRNPGAAVELARALSRRNRWLCVAALERSTSSVPARLAGRLLDLAGVLARPHAGALEMELPLAQEDLGRLAGTSRESTCKTLRAFQRAGLVAYRGRRLRILRPDALERLRCRGRAR